MRPHTKNGRTLPRGIVRGLAGPAALAALAVSLIPSALAGGVNDKKFDACLQSAGAPLCTDTVTHTVVPGGATAPLTLSVTNAATTQTLGSIDLRAPASLPISTSSVTASQGTVAIKTSGQIQVQDLNLAPGTSATVALSVTTPCAGSGFTWTITGRQSNKYLGNKNDFFARALSGFTTDVTPGGCHLEFITQPKETVVGQPITDEAFSSGEAIEVGLFDQNDALLTTCPDANASNCTVTIAKSPTAGTLGAGSGSLTRPLVNGVATFGTVPDKSDYLSISGSAAVGQTFTLGASSPVGTGATSDPFVIDQAGTACDPLQTSCTLPQQNLSSPKNTTTTVTATATDMVDGGFTGIAFNLASPIPGNVIAAGGGCANFKTSGAAGVLLEIRPFAQGVLEIEYGIPIKLIQASPNNGNKFVPICAHARRVDTGGMPVNCTADSDGPFKGRELDVNGVLTGALRDAVCDTATGEWWGILATYQDGVDPATNPLTTGWTSGTAPDGTSLRIFTIQVPAPWDWGHSG